MIAPETVKKAIEAIKRSADSQYFFNQLKSPDWLRPLRDAGFFKSPPPPVRDGNYISFPVWPESRYLARMGSLAPEIVIEIIWKIPETENVRVHEDVIDAALAMPPPLSAKITRRIRVWLDSLRLFLLPETVGRLISHLATGKQVREALDLARTLLAVFPGDEIEANLPGGTYHSRQDPTARFDPWYYGEILKNHIPDLVSASGETALSLLCDLLDSAVQFRRANENNKTEDFSYVWRPAIEDHPQNLSFGIVTLLVSAVRDAAEQIVKGDPTKVGEIVRTLEERQWPVFQRIALHVIRIFPDAAWLEIRQRITDKGQFDDEYHEYVVLLRSQFGKLNSQDQATILRWIEQGPNLAVFAKNVQEYKGESPSQDEIQRYVRHWQLTRLAPLSEVAPPIWKSRYDELLKEFGPPENVDSITSVVSWVGPTSPLDSKALESMSVDQLVDFLKNWKPPEELHSPTPEGLSRELTPFVASDPQKFAAQIQKFRGLEPTYIRSLLSGFRDAASASREFQWKPVIDLCHWVVFEPHEFHVKVLAPLERDPDWSWTRKTIADLFERGLNNRTTEIPYSLRTSIWDILKVLTEDPEPTPEYEARYGGSNMDPATIAINTTRGEAMHALIQYALWVRRHHPKEEALREGFDEMPEVRDVLEAHLTSSEFSLGVRSVYGRFFPQLCILDMNWTKSQVFKIFPFEIDLRHLFDAAWNTYIIFCQAATPVLDVLRPVYAHAIELLDQSANEKQDVWEPNQNLAGHLAVYYWTGKIDLDEESGLLQRFWFNANPRLRGYLFEYIGRSLANTQVDIPQEIFVRLQRLWEFRLKASKIAPQPQKYEAELCGFSWWFTSGKFDDAWAIDQLCEVLRLVNKLDYPKLVVERLAITVATLPALTVECLKLLVGSELRDWEIYGWRDEAKAILLAAINSNDNKARNIAIETAHWLGAKGYFEFRSVLQSL